MLEAIYFLSRARSFRSSQARELIHSGADTLRVTGELNNDNAAGAGRRVPVGESEISDPLEGLSPQEAHETVILALDYMARHPHPEEKR